MRHLLTIIAILFSIEGMGQKINTDTVCILTRMWFYNDSRFIKYTGDIATPQGTSIYYHDLEIAMDLYYAEINKGRIKYIDHCNKCFT